MRKQHVRLFAFLSICLPMLLSAHAVLHTQAASADQLPSGNTRLLRYADISADKVVFSYAGDLWTSSRQGGAARRLTSSPGDKLYPKFSPDGNWIAFTPQSTVTPDASTIPPTD